MRPIILLTLLLALSGCASNARLNQVRDFADQAPKLAGFVDLSARFRDTYKREQPYLSPEAEARERVIDIKRHEAYPDFIALHDAISSYLHALGELAAHGRYDFSAENKAMATSIKAWPGTGLEERHVNAYNALSRLLLRAAGTREQDKAVQALLREGYQPLQDALDAMHTLLRYFSKNNENEERIVMGMLESEIPFAEDPHDRLLAALAKSHQQEKTTEYRLISLRHTLAAKHVDDLRERHLALYRALDPAAPAIETGTPTAALQGARP